MAQAKKSKKKSAAKSKPKLKSKAKPKAKAKSKLKAKPKSKAKPQLKAKAKTKAKIKPMAKLKPAPAKPAAKRTLSAFVTPLDDRVIVEVSGVAEKTPGGLYVPATVTTDRPTRGQVLAVGRGHLDKKGRIKPMAVQAGDEVLFAAFSGTEMKIMDRDVVILREADLLGIVE